MDDAGVIDVEWDPDTGEPRRIVKISGTATGRGTATANLTVIRHEDQEDGAPAEEAEDR